MKKKRHKVFHKPKYNNRAEHRREHREETNVSGLLRILDTPTQITFLPAQAFQRLNPSPADYGRD